MQYSHNVIVVFVVDWVSRISLFDQVLYNLIQSPVKINHRYFVARYIDLFDHSIIKFKHILNKLI